MIETVTISKIGVNGDGIATLKNGETVYVPYTMPNEEVTIDNIQKNGQTTCTSLKNEHSQRQEAPCPYFTKCGGCNSQHMAPEFYSAWKKEIVNTALERANIDTSILQEPLVLGEGIRRRTNFKGIKIKNKVMLGYRRKQSHDIIDIKSCNVLKPELSKLLTPLKRLMDSLISNKETAEVWLSITGGLIDMYIETPRTEPFSYEEREDLADFAKQHNISKFTLKMNGFEDPVYAISQPVIHFNGVSVPVNAKNFLQASDEADEVLTEKMLGFLEGKEFNKVADLFCGRGTFSFAFDDAIKVDGYEADNIALNALNEAARTNKKNVTGIFKNLFTEPLKANELNNYDAIVLDPPRDGAYAQIKEIAQSNVNTLVYISCNPHTFARDAEVLTANGYTLKNVTPVDQFLWSKHIEIISLFVKK